MFHSAPPPSRQAAPCAELGDMPPRCSRHEADSQLLGMSANQTYYSQRNTFADSAVQKKKNAASAATSPTCADHASPFQIP